jgi:hypothetical protein
MDSRLGYTDRFALVLVAMSLRATCLRLLLPKARSGQCLSVTGSPRHV